MEALIASSNSGKGNTGTSLDKDLMDVRLKLARIEGSKEAAEKLHNLELEAAKTTGNLSVEDQMTKELVAAGVEIAKEMKGDLSETKKFGRDIAMNILTSTSKREGDKGDGEWVRKKDLGDLGKDGGDGPDEAHSTQRPEGAQTTPASSPVGVEEVEKIRVEPKKEGKKGKPKQTGKKERNSGGNS